MSSRIIRNVLSKRIGGGVVIFCFSGFAQSLETWLSSAVIGK